MARESNVVYIGQKPPMAYVLAVLTSFSDTNTPEVLLKARGRSITTAVDVAEITRRRFIKDLTISNISISTEELEQREGGTRAVSAIEITLTNPAVATKD
jgi:DNA-binding protein